MILSVSNQKGGIGKTTTVYALGVALAEQGKQVLMIDGDPQASLTISAGFEPDELQRSLYHALSKREALPVIQQREGLDLVPSSIDLAGAEMELMSEVGREYLLKNLLEPLDYDVIIIDTPPSLGLLTLNALSASDKVLVPANSEYLALRSLKLLFATVARVRERINPKLEVVGILPTMYDGRTLHAREVVDALKKQYGDNMRIFRPVNRSVRVAEAPVVGESLLDYAGESEGAAAYRELAEEVYRDQEAC